MTGGGPARFVTFEGGEGSGKSTQAKLFAARLRAMGCNVLLTREPGGTAGAEAIRSLLVTGTVDRWAPVSELLLIYAARADHIRGAIARTLAFGDWVVCDRFIDSSYAYQGYGHGVPLELLRCLDKHVLRGLRPSLTILIKVPIDLGLERAMARQEGAMEQRFEGFDRAFHERVADGYDQLAKREPGRFLIVDGSKPVDAVADEVWRSAAARLGL